MICNSHLGPRGHEYDIEQPLSTYRICVLYRTSIKGLEDTTIM